MLVTGATGGVGRRVVKELRSRGVLVRAMVRMAGVPWVYLGCTFGVPPLVGRVGVLYLILAITFLTDGVSPLNYTT